MDPNATGTSEVKEVKPQKPSTFEGINLSSTRESNELYCDYKCRQWWVNRLIKFHLKGRPIWQGSQGTRRGSFSPS